MVDKETEQEDNLYVGRIRSTDLIVDDEVNFEYHLDPDEFLRMVERNKKGELERRKWRKEHERHGKFNPTNYNLDGNLEGTLNFIYWKCDCCQDGFQRIRPVPNKKNLFVDEGRNVMVKGDNKKESETKAHKVPLCNRCITLYHTKGWLVINRNE
jgi:hypothetical protein